MASIHDVRLTITAVEGHPASRHLHVGYVVRLEPGDPLVGRLVEAHASVVAVDEHDAALSPSGGPLVDSTASFVARAGESRRAVDADVHRLALDVEGDWWAADLGGEALPIAEWLDHVRSQVRLTLDGVEVASASSPVVTGSWGVLGRD